MRRLFASGLVAVAVSGALFVATERPAGAETTAAKVTPTRDAWYATSPLCGVPAGCGSGATVTSYPTSTLHVGMVSGQETARAYLAFASDAVPGDQPVLSAQLSIPLDPDAGTSAPDIAALQVCLVPGGLASPAPSSAPAADCTVSSPASYLPGSPATIVADLGPLVARHPGGLDGLAFALVPTPPSTSATATTTWHVAFSSAARKDGKAAAVEADLGPTPTFDVPTGEVPPPVVADVPAQALPPLVSAPERAPAVVAAPPPALVAPTYVPLQSRSFTIKGHRYGVLWALPLALFVLGWVLVSTYNKDLRSYARVMPHG